MPIIFGGIHFESGHPISNPIGWLMNYVFRCKHSSVIISTMIDYLISNWWWGKLSGHSTFFQNLGQNYLIFPVLFLIRQILLTKNSLVLDVLSGLEFERLFIGTFLSLVWFGSIFCSFRFLLWDTKNIFYRYRYPSIRK